VVAKRGGRPFLMPKKKNASSIQSKLKGLPSLEGDDDELQERSSESIQEQIP
jgi:hypothetical protein